MWRKEGGDGDGVETVVVVVAVVMYKRFRPIIESVPDMTIPALFSFCLCISFQLLDLDRVVRSFLAAFADPPRPARMTVFPCLFGLLFQRFSYFLISLIAQLSGWVGALMILVNEIDPRIRFSLKPGSYSVSVSIFWKAS